MSAPSIALKLQISVKQVYKSLARQNIARRDATETNRLRFVNKDPSFKFKEILTESEKELMIAAIMLYYGEGAKTQTTVDFANADGNALIIFLKFLRDICRVDENRLRFYLYCFNNQDPDLLIKYWSDRLKISPSNFTKPYVRKTDLSLRRTMSKGVLHIRYSDKKLLEYILFLIKDITQKLS